MASHTSFLAAAALIGLATAANAAPVIGQISITGYVESIGSAGMGAATGLDFVSGPTGGASPGTPGGIASYGAGSGSFAGLACSSMTTACGTIADIASFASSTPISNFLVFNTGGAAISFDLGAITGISWVSDATGGAVMLTATGLIHYSGFDNTAGVFSLTAQGNQISSFSATTLASAIPEPASLALLGGSLAAIGLLRRKALPA